MTPKPARSEGSGLVSAPSATRAMPYRSVPAVRLRSFCWSRRSLFLRSSEFKELGKFKGHSKQNVCGVFGVREIDCSLIRLSNILKLVMEVACGPCRPVVCLIHGKSRTSHIKRQNRRDMRSEEGAITLISDVPANPEDFRDRAIRRESHLHDDG